MNSKSNLIYALAAVTSLALGLGMSFWRAAEENHALMRANLSVEMALASAQDEIKLLTEKLQREAKARGYAETARVAAERAGQATRERLDQEILGHQATEDARVRVAAELEAIDADLYVAHQARTEMETALQTVNTQLVQTEEARQAIETAWQLAEYTVITVSAQLDEQTSARQAAETALASATDQVRLLNAKLAPGTAQERIVPVEPLSAPESSLEGRPEAAAGTGTGQSNGENRIIQVRKAGQPAQAIQ
jgi:chromosome segregation ATPase